MDERTEQLMNRKLDGELTEAEALDLDKQLIKSPEVRALLAELEQNDAVAGRVLRDTLAGKDTDWTTAQPLPAQHTARRWSWNRWLIAAAACAALAAGLARVAIWPGSQGPNPDKQPSMWVEGPRSESGTAPSLAADDTRTRDAWSHMELLDSAKANPHRVIGVIDEETRSVYLLEVEQPPLRVTPVSVTY